MQKRVEDIILGIAYKWGPGGGENLAGRRRT
jgi:hypothetical protein